MRYQHVSLDLDGMHRKCCHGEKWGKASSVRLTSLDEAIQASHFD